MFTIIITVHIIVSLTLIVVVLLQSGKGAGMGAAFGGGGGQTLFGSMGRKDFMARLTTTLAIVFMVTSLLLAILSARRTQGSALARSVQESEETARGELPPAPGPEGQPPAAQ